MMISLSEKELEALLDRPADCLAECAELAGYGDADNLLGYTLDFQAHIFETDSVICDGLSDLDKFLLRDSIEGSTWQCREGEVNPARVEILRNLADKFKSIDGLESIEVPDY